jgi:hypothetical protein
MIPGLISGQRLIPILSSDYMLYMHGTIDFVFVTGTKANALTRLLPLTMLANGGFDYQEILKCLVKKWI